MNQTPIPAPHDPSAASRGKRCRVAVVASRWHAEIVGSATAAIRASFELMTDPGVDVDEFEVPGAFDIPLHVKRLATLGRYDAIIACGFIVNGGIYRHEFVSAAVIDGLMRVQLDTDTPVFSTVLTPRDFHDHDEHRRFFREHFAVKGEEVARACAETLASLSRLPR